MLRNLVGMYFTETLVHHSSVRVISDSLTLRLRTSSLVGRWSWSSDGLLAQKDARYVDSSTVKSTLTLFVMLV
jgi:hypothetical protein